VLANGRRWGKTHLGLDRATGRIARGEPVGWYSPTYKLLNDAWREAKLIWFPAIAGKSEQEKRIELITGGTIEFWSLEDPDASRGRMYAEVYIDEAAHARHLQYAWENVITATLLDYGGGAWFFSTPNGRNYFYKLFLRGQDSQAYPDWASWQFPTRDNPFIGRDFIEQRRAELPERVFSQEYLAEFIEGVGAVFRNILANMYTPTSEQIAAHKGHRTVMGVDWGKHQDFTTISVVCADCMCEIEKDRFNKIDYTFQRDRLKTLADKWKPVRLLAEANAMEANLEMLRRDGVKKVYEWTMTSANKPGLISSLAVALEKEEVRWLDDPIWTSELEAFEQTVNRVTGRSTYGAPTGLHDDTVIARALAREAVAMSHRKSIYI